MTILVGNGIQQAISRCRPTKIAVAYIGADWNTFTPDAHHLEAIIVSPTLGTNPKAVAALANQIGWERIFFLDELHAKMYVGQEFAIIGSANLTSNGLSGKGLVEVCVEVNNYDSLNRVNEIFTDLIERAQMQYPTSHLKKARLMALEQIWGAAIAGEIIKQPSLTQLPFPDFELLRRDHFYVVWFQPIEYHYSDEVQAIQTFIADDIHFSQEDNVEKNKWC